VAYSALMTAALSGATVSQLRHWRSTQLIEPEYRTPTRIFYSYRDIVALRTFVYLRETKSLQKIRKAVSGLRSFKKLGHLSQYRLVSQGDTIFLVDETEDVDLVRHPGQTTLIRLDDVARPFDTIGGVHVRDLTRPAEHVTVDPTIQGGHPVIAGTRVPFEAVATLMADGVSAKDVKLFYPTVTADAARSALDFAEYVREFETAAAA
jgi:uncharacterized protein (DUF433 family)/DNA-binding transcriptional MerR regulator